MTHHGDKGSTDTEGYEESSKCTGPNLKPHTPDQNPSVVQVGLILGARNLIVAGGGGRVGVSGVFADMASDHQLLDKREQHGNNDSRFDRLP